MQRARVLIGTPLKGSMMWRAEQLKVAWPCSVRTGTLPSMLNPEHPPPKEFDVLQVSTTLSPN